MRVLTIDTSTRLGTVATIDGARVLCALCSEVPTAHAERLLELVGSALSRASWSLSDLELIACGMGPGSFTGVRVGMATAKGLAAASATPLVGVVSLEAMAEAARRLHGTQPVIALLDAKKSEVFAAAYDAAGLTLAEPLHVPRQQAADWVASVASASSQEVLVCGEIAAELHIRQGRLVRHPDCDLPSAASIAALAQLRWSQNPVSRLHDLEPLYVRPPDAQLPRSRQ
jgi:tRNA threonylcarbamoyladenosine biosynthesis protein TsaB